MSYIFTPYTPKALRLAQHFLAQGELICFPTETVYALAATANSDAALERIYAAKQRERGKPLSLLVESIEQARSIAHLSPQAERLFATYSPGPLTLVLPLRKSTLLNSVINAQETIGIRIPNHPIAQAIVRAVGMPLIGTSANLSGEKDAQNAHDIIASLGENVALIIEGDGVDGIASTVVDMTGETPRVLRQGSIIVIPDAAEAKNPPLP